MKNKMCGECGSTMHTYQQHLGFNAYLQNKRITETNMAKNPYFATESPSDIMKRLVQDLVDPMPFFDNTFMVATGWKDGHIHHFINTFGFIWNCSCGKSEIRIDSTQKADYIVNSSLECLTHVNWEKIFS